ncbi:MAG: hypothetical protein B7Z10_09175 [Rhodobacterales bacterium 32-66-7]|nr:MAG: hypothetical protein B7Z31_03735 [Rhodobacterales bacterium 12-65-15]OYX24472.1 MAG: hypothetical protein B7Z10_09175 [Rhodobacterales bacterium 32-66-7]
MLRIAFCLAALLGLTACAAYTRGSSEAEVAAIKYVEGPPNYVTLYTVINNRSGSGAHSAILVNASERVIFDPAGSWYHPKLPERDEVHYGMTDKALAYYIDYHARATYDVIEQKVYVTPEVAELLLQKMKAYGPVLKSMCTTATSAVLSDLPGFESISRTWFPKALSRDFAKLPGVITRTITDDTDETNHGILMIQANGDPLE